MQISSIVNGGAFGTQQTLVEHGTAYSPEDVTVLELGITGYQRVKRFMQTYGQETPDEPIWPNEATFRLRVKLDLEEFFEKLYGYYTGNPVEILDGACDTEVVGIGSIIAFGIDYDLAIAEVDRSNMSKLGADGKPIINDGIIDPNQPVGKVLKGPNFSKPNLVQFLHGLEGVPAPYNTRKIVQEELSAIIHKYATNTSLFLFTLPTKNLVDDATGDALALAEAERLFGQPAEPASADALVDII